MTSTERESEQARQLREGVRIVQPEAAPAPDFGKVPVAVRSAAAGITPGPGRDMVLRLEHAAYEIGAALDRPMADAFRRARQLVGDGRGR